MFCLILCSLSFAYTNVSGGQFEVVKTWGIEVEHPENVISLTLKTPVLYVSPAQKVDFEFDHDYEIIDGFYVIEINDPSSFEQVTLKANVETNYDAWKITQPTLKEDYNNLTLKVKPGPLTTPTQDIENIAKKFESDNIYESTTDIVDWVYSNIEYDDEYIDDKLPASKVCKIRRGTCDEYSHFTIALFQSIDIPARFIKGYVYTGKWEPHAWMEYYNPRYGWLPVDPTFDEYVYLSGFKVAMSSSVEQDDALTDSVTGQGIGDFNLNFSVNTDIKTLETYGRQVDFNVDPKIIEDGEDVTMKIILINNKDKYYFIPTTVIFPPEIGGLDKGLTILAPYENKVIIKKVDVSLLKGNYVVPYNVNLFDQNYPGDFDFYSSKSINYELEIAKAMFSYWWVLILPLFYLALNFTYHRFLARPVV